MWREPQEESHFMEAVTFSQVIQPACSGPSGRETCPRLGLLVSPELLLLLSIGQTQLEASGQGSSGNTVGGGHSPWAQVKAEIDGK